MELQTSDITRQWRHFVLKVGLWKIAQNVQLTQKVLGAKWHKVPYLVDIKTIELDGFRFQNIYACTSLPLEVKQASMQVHVGIVCIHGRCVDYQNVIPHLLRVSCVSCLENAGPSYLHIWPWGPIYLMYDACIFLYIIVDLWMGNTYTILNQIELSFCLGCYEKAKPFYLDLGPWRPKYFNIWGILNIVAVND